MERLSFMLERLSIKAPAQPVALLAALGCVVAFPSVVSLAGEW
jgi:hypothetical protein